MVYIQIWPITFLWMKCLFWVCWISIDGCWDQKGFPCSHFSFQLYVLPIFKLGCPTNSKAPCGLWVGAPQIYYIDDNSFFLQQTYLCDKKTQVEICTCVDVWDLYMCRIKHWWYQQKKAHHNPYKCRDIPNTNQKQVKNQHRSHGNLMVPRCCPSVIPSFIPTHVLQPLIQMAPYPWKSFLEIRDEFGPELQLGWFFGDFLFFQGVCLTGAKPAVWISK